MTSIPLQNDAPPKLDKPGAGLPFPESLVVRWYFGAIVSKKGTWEDNQKRFEKTTQKILATVEGLDAEALGTRVLVPKQPGLEDSSRYWSAAMALEHLVIVGAKIRDGLLMLSKGVVPPVKPDTASVKPLGQQPPLEALEAYRKFSSELLADIDSRVADRDSKAKLRHPWMGPFTVRQWHWLLAAHQGIHLVQLREIVKGLTAKP